MAFDLITNAIFVALGWATEIYEKSGYMNSYLGMAIIVIMFYRFFSPFLTSVGSDRAKRKFKSSGDDLDG